jgi:hypothetical protein
MTPGSSAETTLSGQRDTGEYRISVFFPSSLTHQKVEMVRVEVAPLQPAAPGLTRKRSDVIPLRLHAPGASVVPTEQGIEVTPQGVASAVFYVTPLAKGTLPAAHLEVLYPSRSEAIALPLKVRAPRSWRSALVLALIPLLLWLPTCWPELTGRQVEQRVMDWLPRNAGFTRPVARFVQNCYSFLAQQHFSLSFWALLLLAAGWCIWTFAHRVRATVAQGEIFRLYPAAKTTTPPPFLTPLTEHELAEIQKNDSKVNDALPKHR